MSRPIIIWKGLLSIFVVSVAACGGGGGNGAAASSSPPAPPSPPPAPAPKPFMDATMASNIAYVVGYTVPLGGSILTESTFGGAAAGDCDSDGDIDLFITYGDHEPNRLYINQLNQGSGVPLQFQDNAAVAGVANTRSDGQGNDRHSGPTFADMDGDGDLDLFIGGLFADPNKLYRNHGDCSFEDVTAGSGIDNLLTNSTLSAAFGDYDLDGDLDLFLTHWGTGDEFPPGGESEHLFRNVSDAASIRFENVSASSGVTGHLVNNRLFSALSTITDYTFTPTFARINDDLWPDIAISADYGTSQLLLNGGAAGGFLDATNDAVHWIQYGMGSALGDIDFDGDLDWFVTAVFAPGGGGFNEDQRGNVLLENPGGDFSANQFRTITAVAGVAHGAWGWGACFLDIDNDTDLDIYHTNGWEPPTLPDEVSRDRSAAFVSDGSGSFSDQAAELGLDDPYNGRGVVCADFDNDGDIDILQLTNDDENSAALWENDTAATGNNFLRIKLIGLPPNTETAGARIFARIGSRTQMREIMIGSNYTSQNPTVQIFGLGTATAVDELRVEWPALAPGPVKPADTERTAVPASAANETLVICHPDLLPVPTGCS